MPESPNTSEQRAYFPAGLFDPRYFFAFGDYYRRWFENAAKASQEILEITSSRWQKELAVWSKFAECRDPKEFAECQPDEFAAQIREDVPRVGQSIALVWTNPAEPRREAA